MQEKLEKAKYWLKQDFFPLFFAESMKLADSGISLVYHSARAKDYLSTIQLQLTPDQIPESLLKVHIRITIEGVVYEKVFEADPNIRYTYAWDGLNEYRQVRVLKILRFLKFRFSKKATKIWQNLPIDSKFK